MADIIAETERLILRTVNESDEADHARLLNSPAIMKFIGGVMEPAEIEQRHAKAMAMYAREGFSFLFVIEKASGEMVGYCGIKRVDDPAASNVGDHEIGWKIREDRWGMGYASEAMRAVIDWAFTRVGAPHLVAITDPENTASWKLMEKLGMVRRDDLDFEAEHGPLIQYSLTADQWESAA